MTDLLSDLCEVAGHLKESAGEFAATLKIAAALKEAAELAQRAASGSWLGYHSRIYYQGFQTPPGAAVFNSSDWGTPLSDFDDDGMDWRVYSKEEVLDFILRKAGIPNMDAIRKGTEKATERLSTARLELLSILEVELKSHPKDEFLSKLKVECEKLRWRSPFEIKSDWSPAQHISRDMKAISGGTQVPPHADILAEIVAMHDVEWCIEKAISIANTTHAHMRRLNSKTQDKGMPSRIFIGHGHSNAWHQLRDLLRDRLKLEFDEFNRVSVAGVSTTDRLKAMLDTAAFAFIVLTAEDETPDKKLQARMNVIHEAGLFQGRLGFDRAIILLEEGCEEFSNIAGLGQIRFPKGNITAMSEEIRRVLEREKISEHS